MCFFCDDKSQAYAGDNNTKCLTAFLTIVWHPICLIIVSITHTGKLSSQSTEWWLSECMCRSPALLSTPVPRATGRASPVFVVWKCLINLGFLRPCGDVVLPSDQIRERSRQSCWRISESLCKNKGQFSSVRFFDTRRGGECEGITCPTGMDWKILYLCNHPALKRELIASINSSIN